MGELHDVLTTLRLKLGVSQTALASDLGLSPSTISEREKGVKGVPSDELERLAIKTGSSLILSPDGWELVDGEALQRLKAGETAAVLDEAVGRLKAYGNQWHTPDARRAVATGLEPQIPYYGQVPCGRPLLMEDPPEADLDSSTITGGAWDIHDGFVIQADGDSMEPHSRDGDWLVCRRQERWANWDLVVVLIDGSSTVKQVQPRPDAERAGEQCLAPLNQAYGPFLDVEGAEVVMYGRVLGKLLYVDLT